VLIATPCTAPILGTALGFAFRMPPSIIFAIFIMVGFGLGFPFLMISAFPKMIKILPKPGEWMNIFKELLGFLLLGFALSMLSTIQVQMGGEFIVKNVLPFALVLRVAVWMYGRFVTPLYSRLTQWIMAGCVVLLIVLGGNYFLGNHTPTDEIEGENVIRDTFWVRFSEEAVNEAREMGLPIFIDFTAAYCTQCKVNDAMVLGTPDIRHAFTEKNVLMLKGDFTRRDPIIAEWLRRYRKAGVPMNLLFIPGVEEPIVFPEILTKGMIFDALNRIE
jgi:thiol:disulfide interchange protein DsbD